MTTTLEKSTVFTSDLFSVIPVGSEGDADGHPQIDEVDSDLDLSLADWPTEAGRLRMGRHILGIDNQNFEAVAAYGYTVYRDLLAEDEPTDAVYLDSRCFLPGTDLIDVLEQTVKCALHDAKGELVKPIITGMVHTAQSVNFGSDRMRKYMSTVVSTGDYDAMAVYVDFMNTNTLKQSESSRDLLKYMAHSIQAAPVNLGHTYRAGQLNKQLLLESVGHAWIRKGMPVAEIDWLS